MCVHSACQHPLPMQEVTEGQSGGCCMNSQAHNNLKVKIAATLIVHWLLGINGIIHLTCVQSAVHVPNRVNI